MSGLHTAGQGITGSTKSPSSRIAQRRAEGEIGCILKTLNTEFFPFCTCQNIYHILFLCVCQRYANKPSFYFYIKRYIQIPFTERDNFLQTSDLFLLLTRISNMNGMDHQFFFVLNSSILVEGVLITGMFEFLVNIHSNTPSILYRLVQCWKGFDSIFKINL